MTRLDRNVNRFVNSFGMFSF